MVCYSSWDHDLVILDIILDNGLCNHAVHEVRNDCIMIPSQQATTSAPVAVIAATSGSEAKLGSWHSLDIMLDNGL